MAYVDVPGSNNKYEYENIGTTVVIHILIQTQVQISTNIWWYKNL